MGDAAGPWLPRAPRTWWLPVLLGLLEPALAYLADTLGLSLTSAVHGALLTAAERLPAAPNDRLVPTWSAN